MAAEKAPEEAAPAAAAAASPSALKNRRASREEQPPHDMELSTFLTSEEKAEQGEELRTLAVTHGRTEVSCSFAPNNTVPVSCLPATIGVALACG